MATAKTGRRIHTTGPQTKATAERVTHAPASPPGEPIEIGAMACGATYDSLVKSNERWSANPADVTCPGCKKKATPPDTLTAAQVAVLQPLVARAAIAAVRQSKAESRWDKASCGHPRIVQIGAKAEDAQRETCAAGKALADAMKRLGRVTS
jgi:hypothetical protein